LLVTDGDKDPCSSSASNSFRCTGQDDGAVTPMLIRAPFIARTVTRISSPIAIASSMRRVRINMIRLLLAGQLVRTDAVLLNGELQPVRGLARL
jgi:hypothetical protein